MLTVTIDSQPVADLLAKLQKRMGNLTPAMNGGQSSTPRICPGARNRFNPRPPLLAGDARFGPCIA